MALHTQRVQTRPRGEGGAHELASPIQMAPTGVHERDDGDDGAPEPVSKTGAHSDGLPRCAGVGVEESKVWVCKMCRDALCVSDDNVWVALWNVAHAFVSPNGITVYSYRPCPVAMAVFAIAPSAMSSWL